MEALILGTSICVGLVLLGYFLSDAVVTIRKHDRTVTVKGLAEREVPANIAIWPIRFSAAYNDLSNMLLEIERRNALVVAFLKKNGFSDREMSVSSPSINDKRAQSYSNLNRLKFRYTGHATATVYTDKIDLAKKTMKKLIDLGRHGIVIKPDKTPDD